MYKNLRQKGILKNLYAKSKKFSFVKNIKKFYKFI